MQRVNLDVPDDIVKDMKKRKKNHEGTYTDLFLRAYLAHYMQPKAPQTTPPTAISQPQGGQP